MKNFKIIIIVCALNLIHAKLVAQNGDPYKKEIASYVNYLDEEFGILVKPHKELIDLNYYYALWKVINNQEKIVSTGSVYGPIFRTNNEDCIIAFNALPDYSYTRKSETSTTSSSYPLSQIIAEIESNLGLSVHFKPRIRNLNFELNDYVTTISGKKPRSMFNADSIFVYDFPNPDAVSFLNESLEKKRKEKYPYCVGVFVVKTNRAAMSFKLFFTATGYSKREQYLEMLSNQIWYRDDFKHQD